jgi:hypothetical protein
MPGHPLLEQPVRLHQQSPYFGELTPIRSVLIDATQPVSIRGQVVDNDRRLHRDLGVTVQAGGVVAVGVGG